MKVLEKGHTYSLATQGGKEQTLTFFKNLPETDPANHDGVLCQEVLRALIDRVLDLNTQVPCAENITIVNNLRECLVLFECRAFRRSLEKSYAKTGLHVEQLPTSKNGHILDLKDTVK